MCVMLAVTNPQRVGGIGTTITLLDEASTFLASKCVGARTKEAFRAIEPCQPSSPTPHNQYRVRNIKVAKLHNWPRHFFC